MAATETVGPFDGTPWAQDQWYRYAPAWAPSGILDVWQGAASAGGLGLSFNGLTPTLAAGRAWARGAGYELAGGSKALPAVAANTNSSLSRRDRLVLRRDLAAKTVSVTQLQGTPASSPAAPALSQVETGQWDVPLFSFLVPPNSGTTITGIVDERAWLLDSGWVTFALNGPLTPGPTGCQYRVKDSVCWVSLDVGYSGTYANNFVVASGLPAPARRLIFNALFQNTVVSGLAVDTAGNLAISAPTQDATGLFATLQYPLGR